MNEEDKFLQGLDNEPKEDPFKPEKEDIFGTEEPDKKEDKEEEKIPFHKDPKIQKFIEKEIERRLPHTEEKQFIKEVIEDTDNPLVDVLTRIIGNDTEEKKRAIKDFQKALDSRDEKVRQQALDEIDARANEEHEAEIDAQNELIEGFEDIEETFNVDLTSSKSQALRSEFVDFIKLVAPKDEDGQVIEFPDLQETFKLFQDIKKSKQTNPNRAKELASKSIRNSSDVSTLPQKKGTSWKDVDKWFSKLSD